ncbi:glycosyltransferase family 4 protein [Formosa sp. S-31]|uniref:glycosyltransferase family 4 protein n=1 Tax=Formosa sp. S-31 TaxID=2790949 RepID=UPI003EB91F6F
MKLSVLIIGFVWPEPRSSAAGSRMMQLIEAFQSQDYKITFVSASSRGAQAVGLETLGIATETVKINDSSFDEFLKYLQPDIVMFDRFMTEEQFGWRVSEHCPKALKLLDTEDLHSLRKGRQQAYKLKTEFNNTFLFNEVAKREIASIYRCDLTLIISEAEMTLLAETFKVPADLLLYLPFMLQPLTETDQKANPNYASRSHFITIGNFLHEPNYQSVLHLKQIIWPEIRKALPKAEVHVYGAYASQKVNQLHQPKDGFLIMGFAESVDDVMKQARVCLAPLVFGAGLKGKLVDAMKSGTPCAMSSIASEGMFGTMPANGFIEDEPVSFSRQAVDLYNSQSVWETSQNQGYAVYNSRFNENIFKSLFLNSISNLLEHLEAHRLSNFTGAMLQHHSLQSTKFMSRWIEEKNKQLSN